MALQPSPRQQVHIPATVPTQEVVEVDMALTRGADHTREDLLGPCAAGRPIPATDLAIDDGGADGVFSAPVGRVDVGGPQEGEHSRELAVEMPGEALGRRQSGRRVDEPGDWSRPLSGLSSSVLRNSLPRLNAGNSAMNLAGSRRRVHLFTAPRGCTLARGL